MLILGEFQKGRKLIKAATLELVSLFYVLLSSYRESVGFNFLKSVAQLFEGSSDVGKAVLLHIELLLQRMRDPLAKKMIEDLIAGLCPPSLDTSS